MVRVIDALELASASLYGIGVEILEVAPQPGLEPGTLRLTAGKRNISRPLRPYAGRYRIARYRS